MVLKLIPKIFGHRGAAGYAPENTLEAFHTAADMGVEWVEFDAKISKDFIPIVFHDDVLDRTTNGNGPVADKTWDELQQLEAGSWFADSFTGTRIPSLEDVIDVIIERDLGINVEIKPCPGRAKETAEAVLDTLSRVWDQHDRIIISSFDLVALEVAQDMAPEWTRGLCLPGDWPENWPHDLDTAIEHLGISLIVVNGETITDDALRRVFETGLPVLAYTINDADLLRRLQSAGVSGVFTDVPDVAQENMLTIH